MRGVNHFHTLGNLTRKPEIYFTPKGKKYTYVTVAVNYPIKEEGEWKDKVRFIPIIAWETLAENLVKHMDQGSGVYVQGEITPYTRELEDGKKKTEMKLTARQVVFTDGAGREHVEVEMDGDLPITDEDAGTADTPF